MSLIIDIGFNVKSLPINLLGQIKNKISFLIIGNSFTLKSLRITPTYLWVNEGQFFNVKQLSHMPPHANPYFGVWTNHD